MTFKAVFMLKQKATALETELAGQSMSSTQALQRLEAHLRELTMSASSERAARKAADGSIFDRLTASMKQAAIKLDAQLSQIKACCSGQSGSSSGSSITTSVSIHTIQITSSSKITSELKMLLGALDENWVVTKEVTIEGLTLHVGDKLERTGAFAGLTSVQEILGLKAPLTLDFETKT